ncbi:rRNA maturation endonuclease Nob1 [Chryseobacterium sediminis]|uniref:rRNA maturation endonuclease Nob1 n=1 Tax=Chryseobacterium sediminis TaxID=1679494 RepID=A0ABR6PXM5_9FLAO|nr:hypothetical protein [Chryseobacterium sediminis]MBB6329643.1 rRNA maturation endonuclease Nob1 [Chryseobacterium sediminis]
MATQICPHCKENSFTWHIDDEESGITVWGCYLCHYTAEEDENDECICDHCGHQAKTKLKDQDKEYWWCFICKEIIK